MLCTATTGLKSVNQHERLKALKTAKIYIPEEAKLCAVHLNIESWDDVADEAELCVYNAHQIEDMLDLAVSVDGTNTDVTNFDVHNNTGLSNRQFDDLFSHVPSLVISMKSQKDAKIALLMLLMRLRKAATYETIGKCFGKSRSLVPTVLDKARTALTMEFVPKYLGFENLTREFLLQNTTVSSRILHCGNNPETLITIWDGTYIYINKSQNYKFQKETYNTQKKKNFLRPMMCVTTNGYIIDVFGPFEAVRNDAKCMMAILGKTSAITEKL